MTGKTTWDAQQTINIQNHRWVVEGLLDLILHINSKYNKGILNKSIPLQDTYKSTLLRTLSY